MGAWGRVGHRLGALTVRLRYGKARPTLPAMID